MMRDRKTPKENVVLTGSHSDMRMGSHAFFFLLLEIIFEKNFPLSTTRSIRSSHHRIRLSDVIDTSLFEFVSMKSLLYFLPG
jgi:hypothetical protein